MCLSISGVESRPASGLASLIRNQRFPFSPQCPPTLPSRPATPQRQKDTSVDLDKLESDNFGLNMLIANHCVRVLKS